MPPASNTAADTIIQTLFEFSGFAFGVVSVLFSVAPIVSVSSLSVVSVVTDSTGFDIILSAVSLGADS